jgi:hypothetical protein
MSALVCEKENAVLEAIRLGQWQEELREHVADCPSCADAALAAQFLQDVRESDLASTRVPSAGWMWWRAQLRAKREAAERIVEPITIVERVAYVFAALSIAGLIFWNWSSIRAWLSPVGGAWKLTSLSAQSYLLALWEKSGFLMVVGAGALVLFLSLIAYLIWAEE